MALLFSEGFFEHVCIRERVGEAVVCNECTCVHACAHHLQFVPVESDTSVSRR